jgi:hypothetical protein
MYVCLFFFFLSGSSDKTLRIFESTFYQITSQYEMEEEPLAVIMLEHYPLVAVGDSKGSICMMTIYCEGYIIVFMVINTK